MFQTILVYGIILTAINCLIAMGFYLIFSVAQVLNLSHGMIIMSACYAVFILLTKMNLALGPSIAAAIFATVLLILIIYVGFIKRLIYAPHSSMLLLTAGLAIAIEQIVILSVGPHTRFVPSVIGGSTTLLGVAVSNQAILSVTIAFLTVVLLILFLRRTKTGRGIRAVSQDRDVAAISGIHAEKIYLITVIITGVLAGIAGVLVAPIQTLTPKIGWEMMLTAFTVTILGGLGGPIWGIVVAAGIVAYVQLLTAFLISPMLKEAATFAIMIVTLMVRPSGLFGMRKQ